MRILNFLFAVLLGAAALAVPQMAVAEDTAFEKVNAVSIPSTLFMTPQAMEFASIADFCADSKTIASKSFSELVSFRQCVSELPQPIYDDEREEFVFVDQSRLDETRLIARNEGGDWFSVVVLYNPTAWDENERRIGDSWRDSSWVDEREIVLLDTTYELANGNKQDFTYERTIPGQYTYSDPKTVGYPTLDQIKDSGVSLGDTRSFTLLRYDGGSDELSFARSFRNRDREDVSPAYTLGSSPKYFAFEGEGNIIDRLLVATTLEGGDDTQWYFSWKTPLLGTQADLGEHSVVQLESESIVQLDPALSQSTLVFAVPQRACYPSFFGQNNQRLLFLLHERPLGSCTWQVYPEIGEDGMLDISGYDPTRLLIRDYQDRDRAGWHTLFKVLGSPLPSLSHLSYMDAKIELDGRRADNREDEVWANNPSAKALCNCESSSWGRIKKTFRH